MASEREQVAYLMKRLKREQDSYEIKTGRPISRKRLTQICQWLITINNVKVQAPEGIENVREYFRQYFDCLDACTREIAYLGVKDQGKEKVIRSNSRRLRESLAGLMEMATENQLPLPDRFNGQSYIGTVAA